MPAHEHDEPGGEVEAAAASSPRRARSRRSKLGLSALVLAGLGAAVGASTFAAFTDTTANGGNQFVAGSVDIDDNDNGTALLSLTNAQPGSSDTGCIIVTTNGSLDSNVRVYGTTTGTGLDPYVLLTVTRGTFAGAPPAYDSCTGFTPDAVDYLGQGNGVIYNGTLQGFPDNWTAGVTDPTAGSPETWTTGETHVYQFTVSIQNTGDPNAAQGLNAQQVITWEARNL
jgi:predicted ribosomally synthesized peptide with SipW-like signal peptide